jgi:hypothetical protein
MGCTYAAKRRTLLNYGRASSLSIRERCGFKPGTCKSARSVARLEEICFNRSQANGSYMSHEKGVLFTGVYLPQKSAVSLPIETQYLSVQKQVSSYQVILCPGSFV